MEEKYSVICDTNVLEKIAKHGRVEELARYDLEVSYLTFVEIITSAKLLREKFETTKRIMKLIGDKEIAVLPESPIGLLLSLGLEARKELGKNGHLEKFLKEVRDERIAENEAFIQHILETFRRTDRFEDLPEKVGIDKSIDARREATERWAGGRNNGLKAAREEREMNIDRDDEQWLQEARLEVEQYEANGLLEELERAVLKPSGIDAADIHHFKEDLKGTLKKQAKEGRMKALGFYFSVECQAHYFLGRLKHQEAKIEGNDFVDYMNTIYCLCGHKYMSFDKKVANVLRGFKGTPYEEFLVTEMDTIRLKYKEFDKQA